MSATPTLATWRPEFPARERPRASGSSRSPLRRSRGIAPRPEPPLLLEPDLARLELAQDLTERVDQLVTLHTRLVERDVDLERSVLRLEDERERLCLRLARAL